jgi:hypothetical protein
VLSQVASLPFLPAKTMRWRRAIISTFLTILLTLPLAILVLAQMAMAGKLKSWAPMPSLQAVYLLFVRFATGRDFGGYLFLAYMIPCFLAISITALTLAKSGRSQISWRRVLPLCWLFVPVLCICLVSLVAPSFVDRYMFSSLPALILLTAAGLSHFRPKVLSLIAASLLLILSVRAVFTDYYPRKKEDWRSATRFVAQNARPGDAIIFYSVLAEVPFEYYYAKANGPADALVPVYPRPFGTPIDRIRMTVSKAGPSDAQLESLARKHDRLWVVLAYDVMEVFGFDSRKLVPRIERQFSSSSDNLFEGIRVLLYEVRLK